MDGLLGTTDIVKFTPDVNLHSYESVDLHWKDIFFSEDLFNQTYGRKRRIIRQSGFMKCYYFMRFPIFHGQNPDALRQFIEECTAPIRSAYNKKFAFRGGSYWLITGIDIMISESASEYFMTGDALLRATFYISRLK